MEKRDNYALQAQLAKQHFLGYDQQALIQKLALEFDEVYLYVPFLGQPYRVNRQTGDLSRKVGEAWVGGNSFNEVLTLFDLMCDSKENRHLVGRWKLLQAFGNRFHQTLLEEGEDPDALRFDHDPQGFARACEALGGTREPQGDVAYAMEVFEGLKLCIQLWLGDEEFPAHLRFFWDENALAYLRYETMYYCKGLVVGRILERMGDAAN